MQFEPNRKPPEKKSKIVIIFWSFCCILFFIFLTLKLAQIGLIADMKWRWVTSPLCIPFALIIGWMIGIFIISLFSFRKHKSKSDDAPEPLKKSAFMIRLEEAQRKRLQAMEDQNDKKDKYRH